MIKNIRDWVTDNWQILTILIFYLLFNFYILNFSSPGPDEATNSLLGIFYHDLISDWLKHPTMSFTKVYNYGITYLTYYPKLTVYYPPLYHLLIAFSYFIFGISFFSAKLVAVTFSVLTLFAVYLLGKELFDKKVALLATIILMTSPIFVFWSRQALIDIPLIFAFTITAFFYIKWLTKKNKRFFILSVIAGSLGLILKWQFLIMFPILFLYALFEHRNKLKHVMLAFLLTFLIASPYLLVSLKVGFLSLQYHSTVQSGIGIGTPRWTELGAWTYYIEKLFFTQYFFPFSLLIVFAFIFYMIREKKHRSLFLIWFLVFYLFFVYIDNKQDRFTMPYMQIFSIVFSVVFFNVVKSYKKYSKILLSFLIILIFIQFYYSFSNLPRYYEPVEKIVSDIFEPASNIAIPSYSVKTHDSVFAFHLARLDRNFRVRYFRFCAFDSIDSIKKYGIKYVIIADPPKEAFRSYIDVVYNNIDLFDELKRYEFKNQNFTVFVYKDFSPTLNRCNYICLTEEPVCSEYDKPVEALQ